jgi:hypothetical protein
MITEIEQQIIEKICSGMGPAEISIEYEKLGTNISASYIRWIKMLVKGDCLELLHSDDPDIDSRMQNTATTSRQYAKMREEQQS